MRRTPATAAALALSSATLLLSATPVSADGNGCSYETRKNAITGDYGFYSVTLYSTSSWTNCNGHTHGREFTIRFTYNGAEEANDWKDDDDDYVRYSCTLKTDDRVVESWSGRLDDGDRIDGRDVVDTSRMYYPNHPRIVCDGTIVEDFGSDRQFKIKGTPI